MTQLKKNIAGLAVKGISILGILFGLSVFFFAVVFIIFSIQKDNLTGLCLPLIFSGWMLVLGIYLMYPSYLMLIGRAFGVIKSISALLALSSFSLVEHFFHSYITKLGSGEKAGFAQEIVGIASFFVSVFIFVLVYLICVKLLERLKKAAYGTKELSGTIPSADKQ